VTRIDRNELRSLLLGEGSVSSPPTAPAAPAADGPDAPANAPPKAAPALPSTPGLETPPAEEASLPSTTLSTSNANTSAFTGLHAELGKVMPTLWRRACESDPARGTERERLMALIRWWAGKHEYQYLERVSLSEADGRRLDVVLQSPAVRLALEVDARFSAASLAKLQAAHRCGYVVLVIWTTNAATREQARTLRHKVSAALGVRNLHWLPMLHAQWGWI